MKDMTFTITADVDAADLFKDDGVNWSYCNEHASFKHKDACEFILHIGSGPGSEGGPEARIAEMRAYGCTEEFIEAYAMAWVAGATRVCFYA